MCACVGTMTCGKWNWRKWMLLPLVGLALSARSIGSDYSSIAEIFGTEAVGRCNEKCPFQNRTGDGHFDVNCGSECSVQQCQLGCSLWQSGLEKSCPIVCNVSSDTVVSRELYCVMGCNEALNTYFQKLRELIGTPSAPALVADSLTATSLSLTWEPRNLANLSYLMQWRYEELPGTWQYYSNTSHSDRSIVVENLRPYTKYRFRVAIFLSGRVGTGEPVYSEPSVVISTLDSGKPSSPPLALRGAAPDPRRVAISWEPGPFANGPLISYVLRLKDTQPNTIDTIKDMPASNNTLFYMFQNLEPAREYEVSVAMRNLVGEGPPATVTVSTPHLPISTPSQQPILILGGEHKILAAPANDMLAEPVELYSTEHTITGVGLDISSDSLFISVSNRYVYRTTLSKKTVSIPIITPDMIPYKPLDLSVDWLNRHLYVLGEVSHTHGLDTAHWEIIRYDFDGKNEVVAMSGFNSRPIHFEVDAYNGYIFFALRGLENGGLHRLDLANISSNGVHHEVHPRLIVRDPQLGAFTVDHADFRVLVAHLKRNTVLSVSLDGREVTNFRSNTQTPMFLSTRYIAYANGLFYWTNGKEMLTEEYHAQSDSYFHNEYPLSMETRQVLVALRSCQPIPVPVNPPLGVQSVMGINRARVSWSPPHLLGHQGSGAWQQWSYHLQLTDSQSALVIDIKTINDFFYVVENLEQNAEYVIRVAAVTESGSGPWSTEFVGRTLELSPTTLQSTLLWSGPDGLLQTNLTGDNLKTLIDKSQMKNFYITDISWYHDKLYLVTNASTVMWYNTTTKVSGLMHNMDNVGSLAVDWVGKKIYWSNPKQQLITRGNFDGSNREPVPIVTVACSLLIDSVRAHVYWSTGHAVEGARLSGEGRVVYYPAQLFSGKQVMGLTADFDYKWLYWLVRSYDGSELHRAPTADRIPPGYEMSDTLVSRLAGPCARGSLRYFGGRLAWVGGDGRAAVADLRGRHAADLRPRARLLVVRDRTEQAGSESLIAIPETVNASSISVVGEWDRFNVTWAPATRVNVNNSRVYYDVCLTLPDQSKIEKTVDVPWLQVSGSSVPPYSRLEARVRAHSPWGGGGQARAALYSPQATPGAPTRPRLLSLSAPPRLSFRWAPPPSPRGVLSSYDAQCWTPLSACADTRLSVSHTQLVLKDVTPHTTYYFRVRAVNSAGPGEYSDVVSASSDDINPIPRVMISSQEYIKIMDLDSGESETIPKSTGMPVDFAVSVEENIVYWVNNLEEVFSSRINGSGHYKLLSINGTKASSICVDWISRSVYYTQLESDAHVTYRAALAASSTKPHLTRVFSRAKPVHSLQIAPLHGSLFWYEEGKHLGLGSLMISNLNGSHVRGFFNNSDRSDCNCPENPQVAKTFVIDMTKGDNYELYWVDPWVHKIIATDMYGCQCRTVFDATEKKKYGFTPMSITVDSKYVYWFNSTTKEIYHTNKYKNSKVEYSKTTHGYKIMALDPSNQKYPPRQCLFPKVQKLKPKVISKSVDSISLEMPPVEKPHQCREMKYEMSVPEYTIFYRIDMKNDTTICDRESCPYVTSTNTEVVLTDLKPFTNYTVMLEATNYYSKLHEIKPIVGASLVLQTAAEAPTAPSNVKATVLTPELAHVQWTSLPELRYEVHWRTEDSSTSPQRKEHNTIAVPEGGEANLTKLSANTTYRVWVRALSPHSSVPADSAMLRLRMRPPPNEVSFVNATPYEIMVYWPPPKDYSLHQFKVQYAEAANPFGAWSVCSSVEGDKWLAKDLRPKTRYRFRLQLKYVESAPEYHWPHDDHFAFETLSSVPDAPGAVRALGVGSRVVRASWTAPHNNGAPITHYRVWGRPNRRIGANDTLTSNVSAKLPANLPNDVDDLMKARILKEGLELLHNGTETYWLIGGDELPSGYTVRVQARNALGWGPLSAGGELQPAGRAQPPVGLALALAATLALALAAAALLCIAYSKRARPKPVEALALSAAPRRPDVELANLRQPPAGLSANILYNQGVHCPSAAEIAQLPHIRREQITLTKFLGSGAFGEVFEGVAQRISGAVADTKVAVKTLKKGATEQEKAEFLKEAALMSNFKHEHILRLLGVCLDNDPNYIIMELMEGGDLRTYLIEKRNSLYTSESLTLLDLLNMCVDVTKGCRYLEEMHFVHRDLACRNCLVAARPGGRRVKIGDFGLARDIYNNDYYRKEGEGLLPVRWMAVECLVDGLFSCQSDVWAWGVLCWEILSLGQQPYPAQTNREVLSYVRSGGTPDRPPNCPAAFYTLLRECWSYQPSRRPSFARCLRAVEALRDVTPPQALPHSSHHHHYLTLLCDAPAAAVDNRTYLLDENANACLDEDPEHQMEPSRLLPERATKYVELMYDSDSPTCDGYEIPRAPFPPFSRHSIVGVAPNRLIKPPLYRTHSLRHSRPPNATIVPLRSGIPKRASLCGELGERPSRRDFDLDKHVFKTTF